MIFVFLWLVKIPDGSLVSSCVLAPVMLAVLKKTVQYGFMLPLVIGASKHQAVFHPDAASGKMETCIHKRLAEIESFRIGMEHISCTAFFQVCRHVLKCRKQKFIELIVCHLIVLNGKTIGTFKSHIVRRVRYDEVCFLTIHKSCYIFGGCGITTHEAVSADCPDIPTLYKGCLLKGGRQIEIIVFCLRLIISGEKVSNLIIVKASQSYIEIHALQSFDFNSQEFLVPACILGKSVVRNDVGFFLCFGKVIHKHAGNFLNAFFLGSHHSAVSGNDAIVTVDDNGIHKAELTQGGTQLCDLLRGVGSRIIDIRY